MDVIDSIDGVRALVRDARGRGCRIGCVPTMGALHAGHLSLVEECRKHVDYVVLTIFVNPTQFAPTEDLNKYPRPVEADLDGCRSAQVDCVYMPQIDTLYPTGFDTWVTVDNLSTILEGEFRPGHFRGVTTIVAKLLNILQPDMACFGAKDFQQQALIRKMVEDLNMPVEIRVCPTIRDPDGLALSSRNIYLSAAEREAALIISRTLNLARERLQTPQVSIEEVERDMLSQLASSSGVRVQYAVVRDPLTLALATPDQSTVVALIAAYVGQTRLIDNLTIQRGPPAA